jgi:predicted transcriptional regulator
MAIKSIRLDASLESQLKEAAEVADKTESELIREAIREKCDQVLGDRLDLRLKEIIGSVHGGGGQAANTGRAFTDIIWEKHQRVLRERRETDDSPNSQVP